MQILCATDFSQPAIGAADVAAALAKRLNLPLRLLHCGPEWVVAGEIPLPAPIDTTARDQLETEAARLRASGIEVGSEYCQGNASWEVLSAASRLATKLIVLGSTGKGNIERWLIGSVAQRVAEEATSPTLVVRQPERLLAWLHEGGSLLILCGVDFTGSTDAALSAVRDLRALGGVDIEAAHIDEEPPTAEAEAASDARVAKQCDVWERLHAVLGDLPVKVHVRGAEGSPVGEFLELAKERQAGLVVVGTHLRQGLDKLKLSSFSQKVVASTHGNVLCVPSSAYPPVRRMPEIKRVVVATDFTAAGDAAVTHALGLLPAGGSIHLVHVTKRLDAGINPMIASEVYFDHSVATQKAREEAEQRLNDTVSRLLADSSHIKASIESTAHENIARGICEAAERFGADVISMGSKGHTRVGAALFGSTTQSVVGATTRPVFIVHPNAA
jgi:nucleotide-binding universal stress UspA family protein